MASIMTRKLCSATDSCKQCAAINCEGCSKSFCTKHLIDHRNALGEELNMIVNEYDSLQLIFSQSTDIDSHPFLKKINKWEEDSIVKIQQKAQELRLELIKLIETRKSELSSILQQTRNEVNNSQETDNFIEPDLREWKTTIETLKTKLDPSFMFSFYVHDDVLMVQNISVVFTTDNEVFEQVFDSTVQIKHDGQVIIHDTTYSYSEIRGKNEYTTGRHKIRLCIEQSADKWTFLGINSKSTLLQKQSTSSTSAYGWTNNNYVWLNGECQPNKAAPRIEMKTNDIISLIFDCENHIMSMINERTKGKYDLVVNTNQCPLPWQFHVNLFEANSSIRIL